MNKHKYFYIIDVRYKQKDKFDLSNYGINKDSKILSLTPYSSYLIENEYKKYYTYSDIISNRKYKNHVMSEFNEMKEYFTEYIDYSFLFVELACIKNFEVYLEYLYSFIDEQIAKNYRIVYITDSNMDKYDSLNNNSKSFIQDYHNIFKCIKVNNKDNYFYIFNKIKYRYSQIKYRENIIFKIYTKYINILNRELILNYDNENYKNIYSSLKIYKTNENINIEDIDKFIKFFQNIFIKSNKDKGIVDAYNNILFNFNEVVLNKNNISKIILNPFTYLSGNYNYYRNLLYKINNIPRIFMQHGSYTLESSFLKYNEIYPADINFVFNDNVKKIFENRGAKKVYSVGSVNFTKNIRNKNKTYDFLYITYCGSYSYSGVLISGESSNLSADGNEIFKRHSQIIELFGNEFKDKTICIKVQPNIFVGQMLYVPFLELSKKYKNVHIEFTVPILSLIEQSKYILSDYFSSDFTNRELHYKRDIFVFNNEEMFFPNEILSDMQKMFILVSSISDLKDKINNIENITKNRKRHDDIIEYYSSKKCDTKAIVTDILNKELNGR